MTTLNDRAADFEAEITILTPEAGGRSTPAFNGIRWDIMYAEDNLKDGLYIIWPEFIDKDGNALPTDVPLEGTHLARMYIINEELKDRIHRERLKVGTAFFSIEGSKKVARGIVTRVT